MERVFLSWDEPLVPAAAAWIRDAWASDGRVDLQRAVCVTPGRRAGRTLLGHLIRACEAHELELVPPRTATPGALPEAVLAIDEPVALAADVRWAWIAALRDAEPSQLATLVRTPPDAADLAGWVRLADTFAPIVDTLGGAERSCLDAAEAAGALDLLGEHDRWHAIDQLAAGVDARLARCGLAPRLPAIHRAIDDGRLAADRIVLVGVSELSALHRRVLAAAGDRVVLLIHAPRSHDAWFDALGCPDVERWADALPSLRDDQVVFAEDPADQAQAALDALATIARDRAPDEITIGLGTPELTGAIEHAGNLAGVDLHVAPGAPLDHTAPARLLAAVADWLDAPRLVRWAALLRHPDLNVALLRRAAEHAPNGAIASPESWPVLLDKYAANHLDDHPGERWFDETPLPDLASDAREMLSPLGGRRRAPRQWAAPILALLRDVYGETAPETPAARASLALRDLLAASASASPELSEPVTAAEAIRLVLSDAATSTLAERVRASQVETLGWHELHHDPAPVLVVVGVNDGAVPEATRGDPFLPDRLRAQLGLPSNEQRLARDAYILTALAHAHRPNQLRLIVGRRNALGDPLLPSRLVLGGDDETLRARIRGFCPETPPPPRPPRGAPETQPRSAFVVPELPAGKSLGHMSVTSFRAYLDCPYRFALRYVLGLRVATDDVRELDGAAFGNLAHEVLKAFGRDEAARDATNADEIERFLLDRLGRLVLARYGRAPRTAVRLQIERLAHRLERLALEQARLRADGWRILMAEEPLGHTATITPEGHPSMRITGTIDRIDVREHDGAFRIYDYKTGDAGASPHRVHHGDDKRPDGDEPVWHDLQLPLYAHFAPTLDIHVPVELGYINLPRETQGVGVRLAEWTEAHIAHAVARATEIVASVQDGAFERNEAYATPWDDYARICQVHAIGDDAADEEGDA